MTITVDAPTLALDPATRSTLVQAIVDSLPINPTASVVERTTLRQAAFALVAALAPTDPIEAMLAAQVVGAHYACMNAYRCAARPDLPVALHVRYQAQAASLSRLTTSKRRELQRRQAAQPTLPAGLAARAAQAHAASPGTPARPATPAPQPKAAAQRPAPPTPAAAPTRVKASPAHAAIEQFLATAAAAFHPADDNGEDAPMTDAETAQPVANAPALPAEIAPAPADMGARLQAEVDARKAAATKLAA